MFWDLFHLWNLPTEMDILSNMYSALSLQSIATHDVALSQITKLNPTSQNDFLRKRSSDIKQVLNQK